MENKLQYWFQQQYWLFNTTEPFQKDLKNFLFQFVNNYFLLFYIAYLRQIEFESLGIAAKLEQLCFASLHVALRDLRQFSWFLQTFFSMLHCSSTSKGTLGETVAYNGLLLTTFLKVLVLALSGTLFDKMFGLQISTEAVEMTLTVLGGIQTLYTHTMILKFIVFIAWLQELFCLS